MKNIRVILSLATLAVFIFAGAVTLFAAHPAYLHALSDLRMARAHLLERPGHGALRAEERDAVEEINRAIEEVRTAAAEDDKNPNAQPPVDLPRDWSGRLRRAMELLNQAYRDVDGFEDNPRARGMRSRALGHISRARQHVRAAMDIAGTR